MATNLTDIIKKVRTALRGEEVRGSIADGLEFCGHISENAKADMEATAASIKEQLSKDIDAKAAETLKTIPESYTELDGNVKQLKEDVVKLNKGENFISAEFVNGSTASSGITENVQHRIVSKSNIIMPYDTVIECPENRVLVSFLYSDDGTFIASSGEVHTLYVPQNVSFRLMYMRNDSNTDQSLLPLSEINDIRIIRVDSFYNFDLRDYRILSGFWYWGNTNSNNILETNVIWRMTSINKLKFDCDIIIPKLDGYIINARIFNGNTQIRNTATDADGDLIIHANEEFKLNIMRDDGNTDESRFDASVVKNVKYKIYESSDSSDVKTFSKKQYSNFGIIQSNNQIMKIEKLTDIGGSAHSQSVSVDAVNKLIYNFGGENYGYKLYDMKGKFIKSINKITTGHDNDCVRIGNYIYFADDGTKSLVKWNMTNDTSETVNIDGIADNGNANTVRNICGVCVYKSDENKLILATYDKNTTNHLLHSAGDKLAIYMYDITSKETTLLCEFDWDCVYIQGCTMYNDMLYVACNIQTTDSPSNYKGVEIKCINLYNNSYVDDVRINGTFENEGLDYCVENGIVYLYTILAHYGLFEDLVKFKAPFIN